MVECHRINPFFPIRVVRSLTPKHKKMYALFHLMLWTGLASLFLCVVFSKNYFQYICFIVQVPVILITVSLLGFRWLARRNSEKFDMLRRQRRGSCTLESAPNGDPNTLATATVATASRAPPQPPPAYSAEYNGPVFTVFGSLEPPPTYSEATSGVPEDNAHQSGEQLPEQQPQQLQPQEHPAGCCSSGQESNLTVGVTPDGLVRLAASLSVVVTAPGLHALATGTAPGLREATRPSGRNTLPGQGNATNQQVLGGKSTIQQMPRPH